MYESKVERIKEKHEVIMEYELQMKNYFATSDCYLKLGNVKGHAGLNLYFTNEKFYDKLQHAKVLALTKVARL
jgi:hypothetical protein